MSNLTPLFLIQSSRWRAAASAVVVSALCACGGGGGAAPAPVQVQMPASPTATPSTDTNPSKPAPSTLSLVTVGNSITRHSPLPSAGWQGDWGMASSTEQSDYSARLAALITESTKRQAKLARFNVSRMEKGDMALSPEIIGAAQTADILVVELGDNVDPAASGDFQRRYVDLLQRLHSSRSILLCTSTYWPQEQVTHVMKAACTDAQGIFVDIGGIHAKAGTDASSLVNVSTEVKRHPGDEGMRLIAQAIHSKIGSSGRHADLISAN